VAHLLSRLSVPVSDAPPSIAKLTPPRLGPVVVRERLFRQLDEARQRPLVWLHGPPGAGKSVLAASYLAARGEIPLWYQVDEGDDDVATFFYFLGQAARLRPLPPFRREYVVGLATFARRWFEQLYLRLATPFVLVLDDFQESAATGRLPEVVGEAVEALHARTEGWAAGIVLLGEGETEARGDGARAAASPAALFDYLASEVFDRQDPEV